MTYRRIKYARNMSAILAALIVIPSLISAQSKVGTTAAPFLGIPTGSRASAMGDAFTAVGGDASALFYNPGALTHSGKSQFLFTHTNWLINTRFNWAGFILNLDGKNALGIHITQLDYGEEEVTTVYQPEGTGEKWGAMDMAIGISYARKLTDRFSIGGTGKYISQRIWNESASSFAVDLGLLFITPFKDIRLGMSISNFGGDMRMDGTDLYHRVDLDPNTTGHNETIIARLKTESWPLPLFFRVGLAMDVIEMSRSRLTVAVDALRPSDNTETVNLGAELSIEDMFFLRAGYKSLFRKDSETGLTFGFGAHFLMSGTIYWNVDYVFAGYGLMDNINMIGIGVQF